MRAEQVQFQSLSFFSEDSVGFDEKVRPFLRHQRSGEQDRSGPPYRPVRVEHVRIDTVGDHHAQTGRDPFLLEDRLLGTGNVSDLVGAAFNFVGIGAGERQGRVLQAENAATDERPFQRGLQGSGMAHGDEKVDGCIFALKTVETAFNLPMLAKVDIRDGVMDAISTGESPQHRDSVPQAGERRGCPDRGVLGAGVDAVGGKRVVLVEQCYAAHVLETLTGIDVQRATITGMERVDKELDALAWEAIVGWPGKAGAALPPSMAEYAELSRWFLWDKVGRAIRFDRNLPGADFERRLLAATTLDAPAGSTAPAGGSGSTKPGRTHGRRRLYVPMLTPPLLPVVEALSKESSIRLVLPASASDRCPHAEIARGPQADSRAEAGTATAVYQAILAGLERFGVRLEETDRFVLEDQLNRLVDSHARIDETVAFIEPDGILLHADNHPPHQSFVFAARNCGIPIVMVQHGLDCERRYLDEAYADNILVWGPARAAAYAENSTYRPRIEVTGSTLLDSGKVADRPSPPGHRWLWCTRPHAPEKCYPPSRSPREGLDILDAILAYLLSSPSTELVIKRHPADYLAPYEERLANSSAAGQVRCDDRPVQEQLEDCDAVISEDSTAAMDAMLAGKMLVHAHFADSPAVLPLAERKAALPGFSPGQLTDSMNRIATFPPQELDRMFHAQQSFLEEYAGELDGGATERVVQVLAQLLG